MTNRVLIISDILPTEDYTAGIVLDKIYKYLRQDLDIHFVVLHNINQNYNISSQLPSLSINIILKPSENFGKKHELRSSIFSFIGLSYLQLKLKKIINTDIYSLINRINPDKVVWVLESFTSVWTFIQLSKKINKKQFGIFWDPFTWWADEHGFNSFHKKSINRKLNQACLKLDKIIVPNQNFLNELKNINHIKKIVLYPHYEI